jgi:hypothetical protein
MQTQSPFKTLKILHTAMLFGFGIFIVIGFFIPAEEMRMKEDDKTIETIFQSVAAVLSLGSLLIGFNLFKKRMMASRNINKPAEKRFEIYRGACIMWWALLEAPGLFAIISYVLTGNKVFIVLSLFHWGLLAIFMPRRDNIILLLNLTSEDVQRMETNKA